MPRTVSESESLFDIRVDENDLGTRKFSGLLDWALGVRDIVRSYADTDDLDTQLLAVDCLDETAKKNFKSCAFICKSSITFFHLIIGIGLGKDERRKAPSKRSFQEVLRCCETLALLTKG